MVEKVKSFWHFERSDLTNRLLNAIKLGIVQSFTLFAPRRIGKTEFLEFDLKPVLEVNNYNVIYFSFFTETDDLIAQFVKVLKVNIKRSIFNNLKIKEINFSWCKISLDNENEEYDLLQLLTLLAVQAQKENKAQLVLLLDEIQELQNSERGKSFVAGLRTALDLNKDMISVIFTGSSQDGLRRMFNDKKAPFFHFGMNVQMELFGREFTDFLADRFCERLQIKLDKDLLYDIFCRFGRVTEYIRHIISKMVLEPNVTLEDAYNMYTAELYDFQKLEQVWDSFPVLEQALCLWLKNGGRSIYTTEFKEFTVNQFNVSELTMTQGKIQYAIDNLLKSENIVKNNEGSYEFHNQFLSKWIDSNISPINKLL